MAHYTILKVSRVDLPAGASATPYQITFLLKDKDTDSTVTKTYQYADRRDAQDIDANLTQLTTDGYTPGDW